MLGSVTLRAPVVELPLPSTFPLTPLKELIAEAAKVVMLFFVVQDLWSAENVTPCRFPEVLVHAVRVRSDVTVKLLVAAG